MGEVFRARDSRLDRIVAIKTSKDQFTDRVENEARAIAALNHPHIAALYDVGPSYLVMEFIEGAPLRGPLPLPQALRYAKQILEALEAAHRKGIVHRDLKPANILVAKSGVKLLDFGLAQMKKPLAGSDNAATMTIESAGTIAGTLQYMAPEQLEGKPADARSDLFAFGLVFYEILTGTAAFEAENSATLIAAIMTLEPRPLKERLPDVPPALERIIATCIAKDPDDRWQSAGDIRRALDLIDSAPAAPASVKRGRLRWWHAALPAFALGAVLIVIVLRTPGSKVGESWKFRPLTYSGKALNPALSPDGKQVAFTWTQDDLNASDLYVQLLSGGNPLHLKDTRPRGRPAWSPDGSQIAFQRVDGLYVIPALGGTPRRITAAGNLTNAGNVAWAPNGSFFIIDARGPGLMTIAAEGGEARALTKPSNGGDSSPAIAPDGSAVAFVRHTSTFNANLLLLPLTKEAAAAGEARSITRAASTIRALSWTNDGKEILFENALGGGNASIWRVSRNGGKPVRVNLPSMIAGDPSTAPQTGRMVFVSGYQETKLFKLPMQDGKAGTPQPVVEALGDQRDLSVSPDGLHVAFVSTRTGSKEIWIANPDGSDQTQLTFVDGASVGSPRWSPDATRIAFDGYASGSSDIYVVPVAGGKPVRLTSDPGNEIRPSWSYDGKWIYFGWDRGGKQQIWKMSAGGGDPVQVTRSGGQEAFESPDGQWLYVVDAPRLYRIRPDGTDESPVRTDVFPSFFGVGRRDVLVYNFRTGELLRSPLGTTAFQPVYRFSDADRPTCLGPCIGVPNDESYMIYRRVTRSMASLTLMDNFR
jgi:Tol biopolymer transport system component